MANVVIVKNHKAKAQIVLPDEQNALTEQAGDFLIDYIKRITGATLEVVREGDAHAQTGSRIFLGATRAARQAQIDVACLKNDGFVLKAVQKDLFVAGRDALFPAEQDLNTFTACRGTLMGVFRLLEDCGGVGWFLPTPMGEVVPASSDFVVPGNLDHREEPAFSYTSATGVNNYGYRVWANGYRRAVNMRTGVHTWDAALHQYGDPDALFEKDPTIFALIDGERRLSYGRGVGRKIEPGDPGYEHGHKYRGLMLCTSHPAFVEMNVGYFSSLFDAGYLWAGYGQSDGYRMCECEKCRQTDGIDPTSWSGGGKDWDWEVSQNPSEPAVDRLWAPMYACAKQLYKKYPDRKVIFLVYNPTYVPSKKIKAFPPNVAVEMCRHTPAYFEAFSGFKDKTIYTYWFGTYRVQGLTPKPLVHHIAREMRRFRDGGVMGIHSTSSGEVWGLEGPAYYAYGKLAWNPDLDVDAVLERYYQGVYGAAAPVMRTFFDLLEERITAGDQMQTLEERRSNQEKMRPEVYFPAAYPDHILVRLERLLDQASAVAKGERELGWLKFTQFQFRYTKILASGFNLYKEYEIAPTEALRHKIMDVVEERKRFLKELDDLKNNPAYLRDWFPGWELYMRNAPSGGTMFGKIDTCPPFGGM